MSLEYAAIYTDLLENPDKALEYIQQDQTLRPDNIDINRRLAKIYMLKKDKLKAQEFIQKAEKTNSKHPELKILQTALASM